MHDLPSIWPLLPGRKLEPGDMAMIEPTRGTIWETCWEYVLTHEMTDTEGSAFWHGAGLMYQAMIKARK